MKKDYLKRLRREDARIIDAVEDVIKLTAKDAMIKPVFLNPEDAGMRIIRKLKSEKIEACIVVTKDKKFVGEISDEDLIRLFLVQIENEPLTEVLGIGYNRELKYLKAKDLINKHKSTVNLDTPINDVVKLVYKEGSEYIPVLDKNKRVRGVVTPSSLLALLKDD
jgi:osmoprotectant transport system ATP-binding protein